MFMQIAFGAIGVGIMLMVGFLVIAKARVAMPSADRFNDTNYTSTVNNAQTQVVAAFGLIAIGIVAVAGFGIANLFR